MPVIAAFKFHDDVAAGIASGQANGAHGGFGAGVHHAYQINRGHQFAHFSRHISFDGGGRAIADSKVNLGVQGIFDALIRMAKNHRAPGADVIDITLAVLIVQVGTLSVVEKKRRAAHTAKRANRGVNTTGDVFLSLFEQGFGVRHLWELLLSGY